MPFLNIPNEKKNLSWDSIDSIMISEVFPTLNWQDYEKGKLITIFPNSTQIIAERGEESGKDPRQYLAINAKYHGLSYEETGIWLDACLERCVTDKGIRNSDGRIRRFSSLKYPALYFDPEKPTYYFANLLRRDIVVWEPSSKSV